MHHCIALLIYYILKYYFIINLFFNGCDLYISVFGTDPDSILNLFILYGIRLRHWVAFCWWATKVIDYILITIVRQTHKQNRRFPHEHYQKMRKKSEKCALTVLEQCMGSNCVFAMLHIYTGFLPLKVTQWRFRRMQINGSWRSLLLFSVRVGCFFGISIIMVTGYCHKFYFWERNLTLHIFFSVDFRFWAHNFRSWLEKTKEEVAPLALTGRITESARCRSEKYWM